LWLTIDV
jgi:hypothetical protein